jgi:hypothetical protein
MAKKKPNPASPSPSPASPASPPASQNRFDDDIVVCINMQHIVYDTLQKEYYNTRTDIFLSDDDITYLKLRPYSKIVSPLPNPLPENYFVAGW